MKNILSFIDQNLENDGALAIPEIRALKNVVENNSWHKNQPVFDHTKAVIEALKKYTTNELLLLATLFHDVAKPETIVRDGKTGITMCPGHEARSSVMMDDIGPRIGLTGDELGYVKKIIKDHDMPHVLVNTLVKNNDEIATKKYFEETGLIARDLLLHALADMEGSSLPKMNLELFEKRKNIIDTLLTKKQL